MFVILVTGLYKIQGFVSNVRVDSEWSENCLISYMNIKNLRLVADTINCLRSEFQKMVLPFIAILLTDINFYKRQQSHHRPWGFQEVEAPRFQNNRRMKLVRLSALRTSRLYPQEIFLVLISIRGWVDPRATVRLEGLCQWKIPVTPSGIETATFRLVTQCLNQLRYGVPLL